MAGITRRQATQRALMLALFPMAVARPVLAGAAARRFDPPRAPMVYTRRLQRDLGPGWSLAVSRKFTVEFRASSDGYVVDGVQIGVEVDAPENLSAFARLEEARVENSLFPLELDASGRILGGANGGMSDQVAQAVEHGLAELASQSIAEEERKQLAGFLSAIHDAGGQLTSILPPDIFAPESLRREEREEFVVPGGLGALQVEFEADVDAASGLMRSARRTVTTALGEDRRQTTEDWSLIAG